MIRFMAYFQIVRNLRVTPDYEIFKAKMGMMEKRLIRKQEMGPTKFETMLVNIKAKADEAYAKLVVLKKEYDSLKLSFDDNRKTQMRRLKHEIRMAKLEFRYACQHWRLCLQGVRVTA